MDLRYDLISAFYDGAERRPAPKVLKEMGITYQKSIAQTLGDQWWFFGCENVPENLPSFITELKPGKEP